MRSGIFAMGVAVGVVLTGAAAADPILECGVREGGQGAVSACLDGHLEIASAAMEQALALARGTAGKLDQVGGGELAVLGVEAAQQAFEAYLDTECKTRAVFAAGDPDPERFRLACAIDLTRMRTDALLRLASPLAD